MLINFRLLIFSFSANSNELSLVDKKTISYSCDAASLHLQECLTVNRITNTKPIKLVSIEFK